MVAASIIVLFSLVRKVINFLLIGITDRCSLLGQFYTPMIRAFYIDEKNSI